MRQPWPAVESEPLAQFERLMELGQQFHQLVQRHQIGLSEAQLTKSIHDVDLRRWWRNYLESPPPDLPTKIRRPEVTLSTPIGGYRLVARYDLIALEPGQRTIIVDWKTNQKRPDSAVLAARLQTRVYPYVLVEAGAALNQGESILPEQVTMVYWFAEHPAHPASFFYDGARYTADAAYLADLVKRIAAQSSDDSEVWPLTPDEPRCRFCTYRSLCDRAVLPGPVSEFDADQALDLSLDLEFDEIEEIEY
jgi:hypothetical protein